LWAVLRHRWIVLLLALLVGAGAMFGVTKLLIAPVYSSSAEFSVEITSDSAGVMNSSYQMGAVQFAANYANEVTGNVFLSQILTEYNMTYGKEMTLRQLASKVVTSADATLPVFVVKVQSTDRQEAYDILQIVEKKAPLLLLNENTKAYINVKLIEYGSLDEAADSPNTTMNTAIGGILAFALVYVLCFFKAFLDKTVYDEETLKNTCDVPVIGQIPRWNNRKGDGAKKHDFSVFDVNTKEEGIHRNYDDRLLNSETPFSVAESFKTLRTNLTYVALKDKKCPVFAITSGFAGAGKSLIIANVAISFAQLGKKVLLIDGDMRCPVQHKIFDRPMAAHGLSEALAGIDENSLETCVFKNVREGLDLMTCGHIPPNPSELLASANMQALLDAAKQKYDYVFIDLPPVLETADAGVLTTIVSGYVVVARAGYSKIDAIREMVEKLQGMRANIVGFVLNDVNVKGVFGYYSHYGHYSKYGKYVYRSGKNQDE
jgi:capsular exopolysaccharide synthesis family protein